MDPSKKPLPLRLLIFTVGMVLYSLGISLTVRSNIGFSPWDILHQGIANHTGLSFGMVSMGVGIIILIINGLNHERVGVGTVANVLLIGVLLDLILPLIPVNHGYLTGIPMMLLGLATIGFATVFYLSTGLGAGPRDGLMLVLTRVTGRDIALVRNAIEVCVTLLGFLLGGPVGLGTILTALTMGHFVKLAAHVTGLKIKTRTPEPMKQNRTGAIAADKLGSVEPPQS